MKSNALAFAIAVASLGLSTLTLAQDQDHERRHAGREEPARTTQQVNHREMHHMDHRAEQRIDRRAERIEERRDDRRDDRWNNHWDQRGDARRDFRDHDARVFRGHGNRDYYYNARSPEFRRGGYIPREFRNPQYRVVDYRSYRLSAPPRGHQWVQVGADYVLIAIATGLIAHIVLNY